jgi:hypothetical protein
MLLILRLVKLMNNAVGVVPAYSFSEDGLVCEVKIDESLP